MADGGSLVCKGVQWDPHVVDHAFPDDRSRAVYYVRRPFLLPRVRALLLIESILLSLVGDDGVDVESLPDRCAELSDD
jgi:hypothetical protein